MKKFFQNRTVAWILLVLVIAGACVIGFSRKAAFEAKKTTELLDVKYYEWINDSADLLSSSTKSTVNDYNSSWNSKYYSVVAVATLQRLNGWTESDYAKALGEKWGLGSADMLLLIVKEGNWYMACGDTVASVMTVSQQNRFRQAIDEPYYKGDFDAATVAFFRQADAFYAEAGINGGSSSNIGPGENSFNGGEIDWTSLIFPLSCISCMSCGNVSFFRVLILVIIIYAVWSVLRGRGARMHDSAGPVRTTPVNMGRTTVHRAPSSRPTPNTQPRHTVPSRRTSDGSGFGRSGASTGRGSFGSSGVGSSGRGSFGGKNGGFGGGRRG
ncbi:MAG: TPM domain-containing protein [Clostridia bacterium]|nr:TPM domain-containing protein [Clostridia bacterium]